jgi:hypothetical protein
VSLASWHFVAEITLVMHYPTQIRNYDARELPGVLISPCRRAERRNERSSDYFHNPSVNRLISDGKQVGGHIAVQARL